jgi:triacylglycerol lipase
MGYRHCGSEVYLNRDGKVGQLGHIGKRRDRWKGFLRGLRRWRIDHFVDHSIHNYIDAILAAVEEEKTELAQGGKAKSAHELAGDDPGQRDQASNRQADPDRSVAGQHSAGHSDSNKMSLQG